MSNKPERQKAKEALVELLRTVKNKTALYKADAYTPDIIETLESQFPEAVKLTKGIAPFFRKKTDLETVYCVWSFLRNVINYQKDDFGRQDIRLPNHFLFTNIFGHNASGKDYTSGDCKSFSLFSCSILFNLGFEVAFRYVSFKPDRDYSHVYCIAKRNGIVYICDGVYRLFNEEKKFVHSKTDVMNTYVLSGIEEDRSRVNVAMKKVMTNYIQSPEFRKLDKQQQIKKLAEAKSEIQKRVSLKLNEAEMNGIGKLTKEQKAKRRAKLKEGLKKFGRGILTMVNGIGVGAFAAIIAMNLNGWASKLKWLAANKPAEFKKFETKAANAGMPKKLLQKSYEHGAKHKKLFLSKKAHKKFDALGIKGIYVDGVGALPLAAIAAAAVPMIGALIPLLVKIFSGLGKKKDVEELRAGTASVVEETAPVINQQITDAGGNPNDEKYSTGTGEDADEGESVDGIGINEELWSQLGQLAGKGVEALANKIKSKSKNPKVAELIDKGGQGIEDYATGVYLRQSGIKDVAQKWQKKTSGLSKWALPIGAGVGLLGIMFAFMSRKK